MFPILSMPNTRGKRHSVPQLLNQSSDLHQTLQACPTALKLHRQTSVWLYDPIGGATVTSWCQQCPLVATNDISVFLNTSPRPQEYCVKISSKSTQRLQRYATWQSSEGLLPSVASKRSSGTPSAMPPPDPAGPNCSSHSCTCKNSYRNQPSISLMTPSFNWNTTEQYDDFQLFRKSVESWFTLQNIPAETPEDPTMEPNSTRLEYVLNFLGNTGHRKFDHWKPNWHSWWDCKEEEASFSLHGLPVINNGPCSIATLQNLPTGRCSHLTWRVTRWTCWPSPSSRWSMQFSDRRWKGMECPVQIRKSPKWQGTRQEAASPRSDGNNIQNAWSVPHTTLPSQTTLRPWDWRNRNQSMPYGGKNKTSPREKTSSRQCTLMWMLYKVSPTW